MVEREKHLPITAGVSYFIPWKITNILEVMKLEAQVPDFPPEQDRIHVSNGTLLLNGTFTVGRPAIVRNRLPVVYNPHAPTPVT